MTDTPNPTEVVEAYGQGSARVRPHGPARRVSGRCRTARRAVGGDGERPPKNAIAFYDKLLEDRGGADPHPGPLMVVGDRVAVEIDAHHLRLYCGGLRFFHDQKRQDHPSRGLRPPARNRDRTSRLAVSPPFHSAYTFASAIHPRASLEAYNIIEAVGNCAEVQTPIIADPSDLTLKGRVCLVTGATNGIGRATATALASEGASLLVHGRDRHKAKATVRDIDQASGNHRAFADFSELDQVRGMAAEFRAHHKRLHLLLNNAGLLRSTAARRTTASRPISASTTWRRSC